MESGNGASSSTGIFIPVPVNSDVFHDRILALLQSAYLFEESKHCFRYTSAFLIKNPTLEDRYNACREKRREQGYSDTDLKETYGFLLFDELNKVKSIGETSVLAENGTCTTLGDPNKGVYLSMYSDSLDLNRWYHGKSGYIAIVKITEGRVKKVSENYTQNLTEPTVGFDCHVSEQLPSVSSKTSSFLAFERTQYYLYELLDNGRTALSPSLVCPYAFVEFSYTDNKGTLPQQENFEEKKISCPYSPWMGKLQLGSKTFNIGIRSPAVALTWAKLPPIIKVEWAISMLILRKLLPKAIFETSFNGQVILENFISHYSLCEIVALNLEDKEQLKPLLLEIKKQDLALIIALRDGGFLILLHDSNFILHDKDNGIITDKALQGLFMFPESQNIQRDTKIELINQSLPSDALRVLPLLIYAEGEVEKASIKPNEDLCDIIVQHMHSYATLINPGLPLSRFREVDIFPDQYDVLDANRHLYSTPEWTDTQWQSLKSYLSNHNPFQLPVCKASEILVVGQEAQQEDLEDDIYICLSSPEEPSTSLISTGSEDRPDRESSLSVDFSEDSTQRVSTSSHWLVPCVLPAQEETSEVFDSTIFTERGEEYIETKEMSLRTDEPSGELIVSITSAAQTIDDERLDVIKHDQFSVSAKLQEATLNTFSEIVQGKITLNCSNANSFLAESDKLPQEHNLESTETPALQMVKTLFKKDRSICVDHVAAQELSLYVNGCEIQRSEQESDQLSSKNKHTSPSLADNALLKELETCTLRKKSERWGLKPVVSTCGRIFIPFGSVEIGEIRLLQEKLQPTKENRDHPEEIIVGASSEVSNTSNDKQQQSHFDNKAPTEPTEEMALNTEQRTKDELRNGTDHLPLENDDMKDLPTVEQSKGQIMLRKLKSVILKKRKIDALKEDLNINCVLDNEFSPKKAKNDLTPGTMRSINDSCDKGSSIGDANPNLLSVDPLFAQALGLTPKKAHNIKPLDEVGVHKSDSSGIKEKFVAREYSSCKPQTPSSPKGTRLKMLKKHQNLSADQVKQKWWLHFQTPACSKQFQGCLRDISVRKTIKEETNSSSEALNLLADLALSTNKGQVSPHLAQDCEFEANWKKCDNTKDVTNPEQQSVLHALLRQPAVKSIQPQEPAPDCFGGSGLVDVIYQEHAYSLPSSPSLLLALPAPFQVSPLNGSSTLLRAQRLWDGAQQMPPVSTEDNVEQNEKACIDPKRSWYRRKFCLSREIENRNKTIYITRHWKEEYDFSLDSRFTVDLKDKAIVRALHGPWDSSIHDTNEEVQLIVHMWIGLFYSRSTARFFHLDPDVTFPAPENSVSDGVDVSNQKRPEQSDSNILGYSPLLNAEDKPETHVLDLSIPKNCIKDTEPAMSNVEISKENPEVATQEHIDKTQVPEDLSTLNPEGSQTTLPIQCYLNLMQTAAVAPLNYVSIPLNQNNGISSEINQQLFIPVWNGITYPNLWTNKAQTSSLPSLESDESHQIENTPGNLPKKPVSPIRKRVHHSRNAKLSTGPNKNEYQESKIMNVKENVSNSNTDLYPTNEDVDAMRSNHLLEIKKKYMEKLKAASGLLNKKIESSSPQNATKAEKCILLNKLLQEDIIGETPKLQSFSKVKTVGCQNTACNENGWINQSGFLRHEVPTFPKDSTASTVKESTCTENLSGHALFNIIGVAPFVESANLKAPFFGDLSASVSNLQEKNQPAGEYVAKDCLSKCPDTSMRKQDAMVENSQDECARTIESPVKNEINITQRCPNDEAENYYSVNSSIGINASIENKIQEQTSKEIDKRSFEDMEVGPSDSSKVNDNASYDMHRQHREQLVAEREVHLPSDLGNGEPGDRCPTPTIDEQPLVYASQPNLNSDEKDMDKVSLDISGGKNSRSLTPVIEETSITNLSDVEFRTLRTLKCLDEYLSTLQNKSNQSLLNSKDLNKESSILICDSNDRKTATSMDDSCPPEIETSESSQYLCMSPFNDLGNMQQLKQKCSKYDSVIVPDLNSKVEDSSKLIESKDNEEKSKSNKPSTSSRPGMAGRPSKMVKDQGLIIFKKLKGQPDCDAQPKPVIKFSIKKTKQGGFFCSSPVFEGHNQMDNSADNVFPSKRKNPDRQELQNIQMAEAISSTLTTQAIESNENTVLEVAKRDPEILMKDNKTGDEDLLNYSTSFVDSKTNKITDDSLGTRCSLSCTVSNTNRKVSSFLEKVSKRCLQDNPTQSSMDSECLIFFDQMKQLLIRKRDQEAQCDQSNLPSSCPITLQFSHLPEQDVLHDIEIPLSFFNQKIAVDMSDKELLRDATQRSFLKPQPKGALEQPGVSAITAQCTRLYRTIMDKICTANRNASLLKDLHKTDSDNSAANSSSYFDFCSQMKREIDDSFHNSLNSVVKKSCKTKNRFFLFITSDDAFFNETQAYLEAEGHIAVQPSDFFIKESSSSPLLVIVRNEDIAEHIFEVPHLLELRKSLDVQFAGIDEPDDVVNLTYQELFIKGGFVMFDRAAVESLSPGNMKKVLEILLKLSQTGKWKWVLHYRDSRRLKETARLCPKAKEKTDLLNKCKEDGLLDILPYHECDLMSRQEPNYLQCLCHLQIQNISSRYPVFVTDSRTDNRFEKNGIMVMTVNSFLMGLLMKTINGST